MPLLQARNDRYDWAIRPNPLLSGRALDVYSGLSDEQAREYDKLQKALLQKYDFTKQGYRERSEELSRRDRNFLVSSL